MAQLSSPEIGVPVLRTKQARLRRVLMPILVLLTIAAIIWLIATQGRASSGSIAGGGSTLAQPLLESAAVAYRDSAAADNPDRPQQTGGDWVVDGGGIDYEATGSLGGILRLKQGHTDFAISDYPLSAKALGSFEATQFPIAVGSVAVVHNLKQVGDGELRLDAATLAGIYTGDIDSWDDDQIADLNPEIAMPDSPIVPIHRAEGSGSTYGMTEYLAQDSAWESGPGSGPQIKWPEGRGVQRSSGMVDAVKSTEGAIGYVEPGQAEAAGLKLVALENSAGSFVAPTDRSIEAAIDDSTFDSADFSDALALTSVQGAYPITVGIYAVVTDQGAVTRRTLDLMSFILNDFDVASSGYVELPTTAKAAVRDHLKKQFDFTD